jgi:hypothetical protein
MNVEQLERDLLQLPPGERREFARWFYDHEREIIAAPDNSALPHEVQQELLRRAAELEANPGLAVPVTDAWFDDLKRRIRDARRGQTSAR